MIRLLFLAFCCCILLVFAGKKRFVFRIDDIQDDYNSVMNIALLDFFLVQNISVSVSIICDTFTGSDIGLYTKLQQCIQAGKRKCAIMNQGLHTSTLFGNHSLTTTMMRSQIMTCDSKLKTLFPGYSPTVMVPVMNSWSPNLLAALSNTSYLAISASEYAYSNMTWNITSKPIRLPNQASIASYTTTNQWQTIPISTTISNCEYADLRGEDCIILLQSYEFVSGAYNLTMLKNLTNTMKSKGWVSVSFEQIIMESIWSTKSMTSIPTIIPTAYSVSPTRSPTSISLSTISPTAKPTVKPTQSPTVQPTLQPTSMQFNMNTYFMLNNVGHQMFMTTNEIKVFQITVESIVLSSPMMTTHNVRMVDSMQLTTANQWVVIIGITLSRMSNTNNSSHIFDNIEKNITLAIQTHQFDHHLHTSAIQYNVTSMMNATTISVEYNAYNKLTTSNSNSNNSDNTILGMNMIVFVVIIVLSCLFLLFIVIYCFKQSYSTKQKHFSVQSFYPSSYYSMFKSLIQPEDQPQIQSPQQRSSQPQRQSQKLFQHFLEEMNMKKPNHSSIRVNELLTFVPIDISDMSQITFFEEEEAEEDEEEQQQKRVTGGSTADMKLVPDTTVMNNHEISKEIEIKMQENWIPPITKRSSFKKGGGMKLSPMDQVPEEDDDNNKSNNIDDEKEEPQQNVLYEIHRLREEILLNTEIIV